MNELRNVCDLVKRLINPVGLGHIVFSLLQISARQRSLQALRKEKDVLISRKEEKVKEKEKEVCGAEQTP